MNSGFKKKLLGTAIVLAMGGMLGGCNGGGDDVTSLTAPDTTASSTTLTGTAAGGAAIIGTVTVKDSKGKEKSSLIDSNGRYTVDVNDMAAPFVMRADGQVGDTRVTYYSAATSAGNVNITQFTELIVANIANQLAESFYANFTTEAGNLTGEALDAAETALQAKLQPVLAALGLDASIDLLRESFAADHSGLDAALDAVRIDYTGDTATLVNTLTGDELGTDNVTDAADDSTAITIDSASLAAIQNAVAGAADIDAWFKNFTALLATSLPSEAELSASGLIDASSYFMDRGLSFAEWAYELSTEPEVVGITVSNTSITFLNPEQTKARVLVRFTLKNMAADSAVFQLDKQVDGTWKFVGDQRMAEFDINAIAVNDVNLATGASSGMFSGLHLWLDAESYNAKANIDATDALEPIAYAVVTGPGLPNAGVRMSQPPQVAYFAVDGGSRSNQLPDCAVASAPCVTVADTVDNGEYTVVFYSASGAALNGPGYAVKLGSLKPLASSALTTSMFQTITSMTVNGVEVTSPSQLLTADTTLGVAWTLPAGNTSDWINASGWSQSAGEVVNVGQDLQPDAVDASLALGNTTAVTDAYLWLSTYDAHGRMFAVSGSYY